MGEMIDSLWNCDVTGEMIDILWNCDVTGKRLSLTSLSVVSYIKYLLEKQFTCVLEILNKDYVKVKEQTSPSVEKEKDPKICHITRIDFNA